jgi:Lrp/AsnC family transcriptional regulator
LTGRFFGTAFRPFQEIFFYLSALEVVTPAKILYKVALTHRQRLFSPPLDPAAMDAIDRKILAVLQVDASLSVAEIGQRVGLSSTPCWKRIQRLEADGVIQKRVAIVDQDHVGLGVTVFVSIETGDHSEEWLRNFAEVVGAMPEVMEFYRMAGDVDYMLRVVVPDIQGWDRLYKKMISAVPLKNVTSRFAMEKIKSTTVLPL